MQLFQKIYFNHFLEMYTKNVVRLWVDEWLRENTRHAIIEPHLLFAIIAIEGSSKHEPERSHDRESTILLATSTAQICLYSLRTRNFQ